MHHGVTYNIHILQEDGPLIVDNDYLAVERTASSDDDDDDNTAGVAVGVTIAVIVVMVVGVVVLIWYYR